MIGVGPLEEVRARAQQVACAPGFHFSVDGGEHSAEGRAPAAQVAPEPSGEVVRQRLDDRLPARTVRIDELPHLLLRHRLQQPYRP